MDSEKKRETKEKELPIQGFLQRKPFERAAQDVGGVKKQVAMLVTWGCHTPERQFTGDVAERIQKIKGERDIKTHELESFRHSDDFIDEHWRKTGKDYSDRKQFSLQKTENFKVWRTFNEMLRAAGEENASVIVDLHYSPPTHAPFDVYNNSKRTTLESNPIVYVEANSKEVFEEYSKILGINVTLWETSHTVPERLKMIDRLKVFLRRFEYPNDKVITKELREHRHVNLEGFVFHLPHKEGEKCGISKEEYERVVASAADTVIRIYDHFNSRKELPNNRKT